MGDDSDSFKEAWSALERRVKNTEDKRELDLLGRVAKRLYELSEEKIVL